MLRNLYIEKGFPFFPIRVCTKKTGPLESSLMATATARNKGNSRISAISERSQSSTRLTAAYPERLAGTTIEVATDARV